MSAVTGVEGGHHMVDPHNKAHRWLRLPGPPVPDALYQLVINWSGGTGGSILQPMGQGLIVMCKASYTRLAAIVKAMEDGR